jgi:asparagine synthetase B (glutamine-hydrolysing)
MGYIAGIVDKTGADASDVMLMMLQASSKGPAHSYGIGDNRDTEHYRDNPNFTSLNGSMLIGSKNIHVESPKAPMNQGSNSVVFKGILYDINGHDSLEIANLFENDPHKGLHELVTQRLGAYSVATVTGKGIMCGLDHIGTIPLYYGENMTHCAVASNKKMLWAVGLSPVPLEPGSILKISENGVQKTREKQLNYKKPGETDESSILDKLDRLFASVSEQLAKKTRRGAVAFSGGVDSTLIAHYLSKSGLNPLLITTGLEGQPELDVA